MNKTIPTKQFKYLSDFKCLADKCPDNCCYGWNISVDDNTYNLWKNQANDLLELTDKKEDECSIKKNPDGSGNCINLKNGLCNIELKYGPGFLSNTCFFYPRVRHKIGNTLMLSAELSCPEITRLCLYGDRPFEVTNGTLGRLPIATNILQEGDTEDEVLSVNSSFINFCHNKEISAEQIVLGIVNTATNLKEFPRTDWLHMVDVLLPLSAHNDIEMVTNEENSFNLLRTVIIMLNAAKRTNRKRLYQALATMESALKVKIDIEGAKIELSNDSRDAYKQLAIQWQLQENESSKEILKRYIQAELSLNLFPYGGGSKFSLREQAICLAFKFAFLRLALICHIAECGIPLDQETIVRVVQGILRYLNHSSDIKLLLSTCAEFGWNDESKLKGMLFSLI